MFWIGEEVIVDFFEGDLDLLIVIGCVYNGDNCLFFELFVGKICSGMKL